MGLSLEQVNELYEVESKAWKSSKGKANLHQRRFSNDLDPSVSVTPQDKKGGAEMQRLEETDA